MKRKKDSNLLRIIVYKSHKVLLMCIAFCYDNCDDDVFYSSCVLYSPAHKHNGKDNKTKNNPLSHWSSVWSREN